MIWWTLEDAYPRQGLNIGWFRGPRIILLLGKHRFYLRLRLYLDHGPYPKVFWSYWTRGHGTE